MSDSQPIRWNFLKSGSRSGQNVVVVFFRHAQTNRIFRPTDGHKQLTNSVVNGSIRLAGSRTDRGLSFERTQQVFLNVSSTGSKVGLIPIDEDDGETKAFFDW